MDVRIWLPLTLLFISLFIGFFIMKLWLVILFLLPAVGFILNVFLNTSYTITPAGELIIRCGILYKQRLAVQTISKISHTTNPLSSPALSLNRLLLFYEKGGRVMISPKDEQAFIEAVKSYNPQLIVQ